MDQRTNHMTVTQTLGKTTFTWNDSTPLEFKAVTQYAIGEPEYPQEFDLAQLTKGFEESFLLGLKDLIMQRHLKVRMRTMKHEYLSVVQLLKKIQSDQTSTDLSKRLMEANKISSIDTGLMLAVREKLAQDAGWINRRCIDCLKDWFRFAGHGAESFTWASMCSGTSPTPSMRGLRACVRFVAAISPTPKTWSLAKSNTPCG
jgi:hypothetical protein